MAVVSGCGVAVLGGADVAKGLRLSRHQARDLATMREELGKLTAAAELAYRHGGAIARDVILARAASLEMPPPQGWEQAIIDGEAAVFPVTAADLMPELQGPALGARLHALTERWIASGFALDREGLLR